MKFKILLLFICCSFFVQAQVSDYNSFNNTLNSLLMDYVVDGKVNYEELSKDNRRKSIREFIANASIDQLNSKELKAFRVNAYNFLVLDAISEGYPISSVQEITGFFDRVKHDIEGKSMTLNKYEKNYILRIFNDPRLHFVLNCGAVDCPPLISGIYEADKIEEHLGTQTKIALDNPDFLSIQEDKILLSQIFNWYAVDFGGTKRTIFSFINLHRSEPVNTNLNINYDNYDWLLNDLNPIKSSKSNADFRYVVSSTIPKGRYELKLFNNLYSQKIGDSRVSYFTTLFSALYGVKPRLNLGIAGRYRAVSEHSGMSSAFDIVGFRNTDRNRIGLTAIGPMMRYAPVPKWKNFSIQSTLTFPIGKHLSGNAEKPFIDWNGVVLNTQFFNDFTISPKFSVFTEIDLLFEDIGLNRSRHNYQVSTPVTVIASYFPHPKTTFYALAGYSPYVSIPYRYFFQTGAGFKYQITSDFELELLYTLFRNNDILRANGHAETFNFGLRKNL